MNNGLYFGCTELAVRVVMRVILEEKRGVIEVCLSYPYRLREKGDARAERVREVSGRRRELGRANVVGNRVARPGPGYPRRT